MTLFLGTNLKVLLVANFIMINMYLKVAQELRRLELVSNSPLISKMVELYKGMSILRHYKKMDYTTKIYKSSVNEVLSIFLHNKYAIIFVYILNSVLISLFICVAFLLICSSQMYNWKFLPNDITYVSLTLNWILIIPSFIEAITYYYTEFVQSMSSVERMIFNVDKKTYEGPLRVSENPEKIDTNVEIEIRKIYSKYREGLPYVLKGLNMNISKNQKVALVGRTGSGKSSLMLALTRMLNIENSVNFKQICEYQQIKNDTSL